MSPPLANHFASVMPTIASSVALVHQLVDSAKEGISTNDAVLEVMTMLCLFTLYKLFPPNNIITKPWKLLQSSEFFTSDELLVHMNDLIPLPGLIPLPVSL